MQKNDGKVFIDFENGQKKCPKMKTLDILWQIIQFCDHN
jgi:hypothetical protein